MVIDIIERAQKYTGDYEGFCNQNCIRHVLDYYNVPAAALFINSALSLALSRQGDTPADYSLTYDDRLVLPAYLDKMTRHKPLNRTAEEVWEENIQRVAAGVPVITGVDVFYLDYAPAFHKYHGSHGVILCGYSAATAVLVDVYEWQFKGEIALNSFLAARSSACPKDMGVYSGTPIDNAWIEVAPHGWQGDPEALLATTLGLTLEQYYHADVDETGRIFYGVAALHKIAHLLTEHQALYLNGSFEVLDILRIALLLASSKLKLFRHYMVAATELVDLPALHQVTQHITNDTQRWAALMRLVLKSMYRKDTGLYTRLVQSLHDVIQAEEQRYNELYALHQTLQT